MKARTLRLALVLLAFCMAGSACILGSHQQRKQRPRDLDYKLGPFTYLEEGKLIGLAAGAEAARYREHEKFMPVAIGLANKGASVLKLSRESFVLQDESGRRYPLATFNEVSAGYGPSALDRTFTATFGMFLSHYPSYERVESNFFPERGTSRLIVDRVELPRYRYIVDWLYFPIPEDGVLGHRFELHVNAPGLEDDVWVKFLVD